jgi:hypothetical protein
MLRLSPDDLRNVAAFLDALTEATKATGVQARGHMVSELTVADEVLNYCWDEQAERYVLETES